MERSNVVGFGEDAVEAEAIESHHLDEFEVVQEVLPVDVRLPGPLGINQKRHLAPKVAPGNMHQPAVSDEGVVMKQSKQDLGGLFLLHRRKNLVVEVGNLIGFGQRPTLAEHIKLAIAPLANALNVGIAYGFEPVRAVGENLLLQAAVLAGGKGLGHV